VAEQNAGVYVWVVADGTATRRPVTRGADRLDQVEIKSGLSAGEAVIINAPQGLTDRAMVRVKGA